MRFAETGVLREPLRLNLVVGIPGGLAATARNLLALVEAVPAEAIWSVTAVGRHQTRLLSMSILLGASGVRVGFEDNVYLAKGRLATSNAELVAQIRDVAVKHGRPIPEPHMARAILGVRDPTTLQH